VHYLQHGSDGHDERGERGHAEREDEHAPVERHVETDAGRHPGDGAHDSLRANEELREADAEQHADGRENHSLE
jgi:hypothetical protein